MKVGAIFIGVVVGCLAGFFLGPHSPLLTQDSISLQRYGSLTAYSSPDPDSRQLTVTAGSSTSYLRVLDQQARFARLSLDGDCMVRGTKQPDVLLVVDHVYLPASEAPTLVNRWGDRFIGVMSFLGEAFIRLIKMLVIPIIIVSMILGVAAMGNVRRLGRLGGRLLGWFVMTTVVAITIGVVLTNIVRPGEMLDPRVKQELLKDYGGESNLSVQQRLKSKSLSQMVLDVIPDNPVKSMVDGDLLALIFFSLFIGVSLTALPQGKGKPVISLLQRVNDALLLAIKAIMYLAPVGVGALMAVVVGSSGWGVLGALAAYSGVVILGLALMMGCYGLVVLLLARRGIGGFFAAIRPAQMLAFATSSSAASLPVTLEVAKDGLGLSPRTYNLVLPLGTTINMDGTALYQGVAAVFIAQVFGMDLTFADQVRIVITATMASIGAAGVPGVGLVTLAMVLESIGVPAIGLALILGPDRILDMFRTATNVTGDLTAATVLDRLDGSSRRQFKMLENVDGPAVDDDVTVS